jgi:hypothetical protein
MTSWQVDDLPVTLQRRIVIHLTSRCWVVTGSTDRDGYARYGGRMAHRVIWEHLVGPIPPGLDLDHREDFGCLFKNCGWPGHLLPVTHFVNCTRDGAGGVGAINIRKTHCGRCGAAYDLFNTYVSPDGRRDCRICIARRTREYRARQRTRELESAA